MVKDNEPDPCDVVIGPVRLSFPSLFEKRSPGGDGEGKPSYQATLLIPPDTDMAPVKRAIKAAMMKKFGKVVPLAGNKMPVHRAEEKDYEGYEEGWLFVPAKNPRKQPALVDRKRRPVTDEEVFYPGCWVTAYITAYAYQHPTGGRGVSFDLNALQFVKDDESFAQSRRSTDEVFDVLAPIDGVDDDDAEMFGDDDEPKKAAKPGKKGKKPADDEDDDLQF